MCMVDYCDDDWVVVKPRRTVTARKPHRCGECRREIAAGEQYESITGLNDYGFTTCKTCRHCVAVRSWLNAWCNGWMYHAVLEDLEEHWAENWELRGRYLARAIAGMRRRWSDGADRVMGEYHKPKVAA